MIMRMYNIAMQKNKNLSKSMTEVIELLKQLFQFARNLIVFMMKNYKSEAQEFFEEFEVLRKKMPIEIDKEIKEEEVLEP